MATRYQPRITINNPEKNVPDSILEQFFMAIRSADLDKIRDFSLRYKSKYSVIENAGKPPNHKTPFHAVLELDDKIADTDTKLRIMQYLALMGAPMDLPDNNDIWPIHLAAGLQSEEIVDFLLKNKVSIDRFDSSHNTPLHYAVYGREIPCRQTPKVGKLESKNIDQNLNDDLIRINQKLARLISSDPELNDNLIHIINTIEKIPLMYAESEYELELQSDVVKIFTETATDPNLITDNAVTQNTSQINTLINSAYDKIKNDVFGKLTDQMDIAPGNGGWGPNIPTGSNPSDRQPPTPLGRIFKRYRIETKRELENEYNTLRNRISTINTTVPDSIARDTIPKTLNYTNYNFLENLVFCPDCPSNTPTDLKSLQSYGEITTLTKVFYLLMINRYILNYPKDLANRIVSQYSLFNRMFFTQILDKGVLAKNQAPYLYGGSFDYILNDGTFDPVRKQYDQLFNSLLDTASVNDPSILNCISRVLRILFSSSDDDFPDLDNSPTPYDTVNSVLETQTVSELIIKNPELSTLIGNSINLNQSWYRSLNNFLRDNRIRPLAGSPNPIGNNIFALRLIPGTYFPSTPFATSANPNVRGGGLDSITYLELYQIFNSIEKFFTRGDFQVRDFPDIFNNPINQWQTYIDGVANTPLNAGGGTVGESYPEFIDLYRILAFVTKNTIVNTIANCIQNVIDIIPEIDDESDDFQKLSTLFTPLNNSHLIYTLLPAKFDPESIQTDEDFSDLTSVVWDNSNSLARSFNQYFETLSPDFVDNFYNNISPAVNFYAPAPYYLDTTGFARLNQLFQTFNVDFLNETNNFISNTDFRSRVRQYLNNLLPRFTDIANKLKYVDDYEQNLQKLQNSRITDNYFLTETVGYQILNFVQRIKFLQNQFVQSSYIIADIIAFINNNTMYYVPQVFLPALIKTVLISTYNLLRIGESNRKLLAAKSVYYPYIDLTINSNSSIISLSDNLNEYIDTQMNTIYNQTVEIVNYHNSVIDFLNYHSAWKLINSRSVNIGGQINSTATNLFTMNLNPVSSFPNLLDSVSFETLERILRSYRIPQITYHGDGTEATRIRYNVFGLDGNPAVGQNYQFIIYRDVISYQRRDTTISNSPAAGQNLQINIIATNNGGADPVYIINRIPTSINGSWLDLRINNRNNSYNPSKTRFADAFISYEPLEYIYDWLVGMPPSIRQLASNHLSMLKQRIIEETIQKIVNNKYAVGAAQDPDLLQIYDDIRNLGSDRQYGNVDESKIYVIIGKLMDSTLNNLFEYSIRQSIGNWVMTLSSDNPNYDRIVDEVQSQVKVFSNPSFLKQTLTDNNQNAIRNLLADPTYQPNTEPDLGNLPFTSKPVNKNLIHYLYNIDYYSTSSVNKNKRCAEVNPLIVQKLINDATINSKNYDGNTPLHYAVESGNAELVQILVERGAKANSFKNFHGWTPLDLAAQNIQFYNQIIQGETVGQSISNFVQPFNDLLVRSLTSDKYNNNIVKNVTLAIPIIIVMYNHLFYNYLQNYRYGFTFELKSKIIEIIKKYYNNTGSVYPYDLFQIDSDAELESILRLDYPTKQNIIKSESETTEQSQLRIQLDGLSKELQMTTDPDQILFLNNLKSMLGNRLASIKTNVNANNNTNNATNLSPYISAYRGSLKNIMEKTNRDLELVQFYKQSFRRLGTSNQLYLAIWINYLEKSLNRTPSMIFSLLSNILNHNLNQLTGAELETITDFYRTVSKYIQSKNPNGDLSDPMLQTEMNMIVYSINLILTPAVKNIIYNQFYSGLKTLDPLGTIVGDYDKFLQNIDNQKFNGVTINSYLETYLPVLSIKYYSNIYSNSSDPDRRISSSEDLFNPILQIVKNNSQIQLTDDSELIKNFRDFLIPFLSNTYQYFIYYCRLSIYGFDRYALNTSQLLEVYRRLKQNQ